MSDTHNSEGIALPCANSDCNFTGHSGFDNYCSVCYKQRLNTTSVNTEESKSRSLKSDNESMGSKQDEKSSENASCSDISVSNKSCSDKEASDESPVRIQKNRKRCFDCRKKIGLTGFECRCGFMFCGQHRLPEDHECNFDHITFEREQLRSKSHKIEPVKVELL